MLKKIQEKCTVAKEENFEDVLEKFVDREHLVIITSKEVFLDNKYFKTNATYWENQRLITIKEDLCKYNFFGAYIYKEKFHPVLITSNLDDENIVLVLNKEKFGKLYQYKIVDEEGHEHKDFYIDIKTCDQPCVQKQLQSNPPDWFKNMSENEQVDYIATHVILKIFEKLEFKFINEDEFEGYVWRASPEKVQKKSIPQSEAEVTKAEY